MLSVTVVSSGGFPSAAVSSPEWFRRNDKGNGYVVQSESGVLDLRLDIPQAEEGPGYGAAMLAMVGCGQFESVQSCVDALVRVTDSVEPDPALAARYEERYQKFRKIYPAMKNLFQEVK